MANLRHPLAVQRHQYFGSQMSKTVCVSNVLAALGIPPHEYPYSWSWNTSCTWRDIIRLNHYDCRVLHREKHAAMAEKNDGKPLRVGGLRKLIRKSFKETESELAGGGVLYVAHVHAHLMMFDQYGNTVVDSAPRKRDARKVHSVQAVFPLREDCPGFDTHWVGTAAPMESPHPPPVATLANTKGLRRTVWSVAQIPEGAWEAGQVYVRPEAYMSAYFPASDWTAWSLRKNRAEFIRRGERAFLYKGLWYVGSDFSYLLDK